MSPQQPINDSPRVSPFWLNGFSAYGERYLKRHFHAVRMLNAPPPVSAGPLVIYLNHASWWDPMVCLLLRKRFFPQRLSFAPIDAQALRKYAFFRKLGFFPVDKDTTRGAIDFLRHAAAALATDAAALWLTPQGAFRDPRERPLHFRSGIGHLPSRVPNATFLPLAIEYVFWEERLPEICLSFGEPALAAELDGAAGVITHRLEKRLERTQDDLANAVIRRDAALQTLFRDSRGVNGFYDLWRQAKASWQRQPFQPGHGTR